MTTIVIENDPVLRIVEVLLDPDSPAERRAAFADYMAHDLPDFDAWAQEVLAQAPGLYPSRVIAVDSVEAMREALERADGLVKEELPFGASDLAGAPRLKFVQQYGARTDTIDLDACAARGLPVFTQPRRTNIAVAEHALAMIMALSKRLNEIDGLVTLDRLREAGFAPGVFDTRHTANANWGRISGLRTLSGRTLGLLGLGEIGRELARMATGIGMRVVYHKRTRASADKERETGATFVSLADLLAQSDVVSMHVPKQVTDLVDAAALAAIKPGALLVNTARATCVNREAMVGALKSGRLGGAAFDVLYDEPMRDGDELLDMPNVLLTPHLAGASRMNGLDDMRDTLVRISGALRAG